MKDWTAFKARRPHPPFTWAEFRLPTREDATPFRRDDWERLAQGRFGEVCERHDVDHIEVRHPWCLPCVLDEDDYARDTEHPQQPTYDDVDLSRQEDYLHAAEATALSRIRWWMVRHRGELPDPDLPIGSSPDSEFLTRSQLRDLPQPEPLITGILPRHSYGLLTGRDGTFKSFVALDWACHLATGRPWNGRFCDPAKVLYIAGEGAYGLNSRLDAWEAHHGLTLADNDFVVRRSGLSLYKPGAEFHYLLEFIERGEFGLVVVDTLRRVTGSADGNSSEMGAVVDNLARVKAATKDGTVLVVAHTGKDDKDTRGFSGIEDDADFVWHASREDSMVELTNAKQKDGPASPVVRLQASAAHGSLVLVEAGTEVVVASESQIKVMNTLAELFPDGTGGSTLRDVVGMPPTSFYRALAQLVEAGHVIKSGTAQRPFYVLAQKSDSQAIPTSDSRRSRPLPHTENASDQQIPNDSHPLPPDPPTDSHDSPVSLETGIGNGPGARDREEAS